MKFIRLDLLTLLVSLFVLSSCENPDSIGLDIDPDNAIEGEITVQNVTASTVTEDSMITSGLSRLPLGNVEDPVFGKTESGIALSLGFMDSSKVTFGTSPKLLKADLVLRYSTEFYGDSTGLTEYTVNIHQLNKQYNTSNTYYNTSTWEYNPAAIGSTAVNYFAIRDSIYITQYRKGKADTSIKVPPQLRIPLNSSFIETNFFSASTDNFSSETKFAEYFKGIYLTLDKNTDGNGGVVFFVPDTSSRLELVYERQNGSTKDTNIVRFSIDAASASVKHEYPASVQQQLDNPAQQFDTVLVQPMGGLRTKLHFPDIQQLKSLGKIAINKAELVIYTDESETNFSPSPRLTLYRTDIAAQRQSVPDGYLVYNGGGLSLGDSRAFSHPLLFGGFYDDTKKRYVFNLTSYIQDIYSGKLKQYDTFIAPVPASSADIPTQPSALTAAPAALINDGSNKMKLNIIYTTLE